MVYDSIKKKFSIFDYIVRVNAFVKVVKVDFKFGESLYVVNFGLFKINVLVVNKCKVMEEV